MTFFKNLKKTKQTRRNGHKHSAEREIVKCFFFFSFAYSTFSTLTFALPTTANKLDILPVSVYPDITVRALDNLLCVKIRRSSSIYKTEGSRNNNPVGKMLFTNGWSVFPVVRNFIALFHWITSISCLEPNNYDTQEIK